VRVLAIVDMRASGANRLVTISRIRRFHDLGRRRSDRSPWQLRARTLQGWDV